MGQRQQGAQEQPHNVTDIFEHNALPHLNGSGLAIKQRKTSP
jgi:hypothetical protein